MCGGGVVVGGEEENETPEGGRERERRTPTRAVDKDGGGRDGWKVGVGVGRKGGVCAGTGRQGRAGGVWREVGLDF